MKKNKSLSKVLMGSKKPQRYVVMEKKMRQIRALIDKNFESYWRGKSHHHTS